MTNFKGLAIAIVINSVWIGMLGMNMIQKERRETGEAHAKHLVMIQTCVTADFPDRSHICFDKQLLAEHRWQVCSVKKDAACLERAQYIIDRL